MKSPTPAEKISHPIPPVWNCESRILLLVRMPSPASRRAGFFYMHGQNRFWRVLFAVFGEELTYTNKGFFIKADSEKAESEKSAKAHAQAQAAMLERAGLAAAIKERRDFLIRHHIALWDVLASCEIEGAADASIKNATPNDFTEIFEKSRIRRVSCTGKTAFALWQKHCADTYEERFNLTSQCLPSTSPANAAWSLERLIEAYSVLRKGLQE
ncbi:MAG: uracil-DNA glycosylase family protein [Treponema sp.]|nr:uracil-DNA glycosylase family protein [Treponema sp.]